MHLDGAWSGNMKRIHIRCCPQNVAISLCGPIMEVGTLTVQTSEPAEGAVTPRLLRDIAGLCFKY